MRNIRRWDPGRSLGLGRVRGKSYLLSTEKNSFDAEVIA